MRVAGFAAGVGATVAWYALPDYVRSRPLRGLAKAGLLGVLGWSMVAQLPEGAELPPYDDEDVDCSKSSPVAGEDPLEGVTEADPAELAVLAGAALGSAMITVGVERWLFRRGERRRAQGARFAHTRQGLVLGGLEAALTVVTFSAGAVRGKLSKD
jgi:hypothetical protein